MFHSPSTACHAGYKDQESKQLRRRIFLYLTPSSAGSRGFPLPSFSSQKGIFLLRQERVEKTNSPSTVQPRYLELPSNSNWVSFPLDLTQLFSHFYSVNSNSGNSKTPLTQTKFRFPWSKCTLITRISGCYNSPRMPIDISHSLFLSCDRILTLEKRLQQFDFSATNRSSIWQLFTDHKFNLHCIVHGSAENQ